MTDFLSSATFPFGSNASISFGVVAVTWRTIASIEIHFPSTQTSDQKKGNFKSESGVATIHQPPSPTDIPFPLTFGRPKSSSSDSSSTFRFFPFFASGSFFVGVDALMSLVKSSFFLSRRWASSCFPKLKPRGCREYTRRVSTPRERRRQVNNWAPKSRLPLIVFAAVRKSSIVSNFSNVSKYYN